MSRAAVTATLNLDTKEWTRELTKGKEQLRAMQSVVSGLKLKPIKLPPIDRGPMQQQWTHLEGQWNQIRKTAEASMRSVDRSARGGGSGLLVMGQMLDDAQYGFRAISGQIPQLVQSFGGSAGLAGAVGLAATSFFLLTKAYTYYQEAAGNQESEEQIASRQRKIAAQAAESKRRVEESIKAYRAAREDQNQRETGGMEHYDRELEQTQRLADAQKELDLARSRMNEGAGAAAAEAAIRNKAEEESLTRQIDLLKQKETIETARIADSGTRLRAMRAELDTIPKYTRVTEGVGGSRQTITEYSTAYRDRANQLKGMIEIEEKMLQQRQSRLSDATRQRDDLTYTRDKILPVKRATDEQNIANDEAKTRARKNADNVRTAFRTFQQWGEDLVEIGKLMKDQADRQKAQAAARAQTEEDAAIAHQRSRGHTSRADRMQRDADRRRRVKSLIDNEGFTPEDADALARQEERDKRGRTGQKITRGPQNPTGLDAFDFRPRSQRPETPNVEDTRKANTRRFREKEQEAGKGGGIETIVTTLKELGTNLSQKLEELKAATRLPVADALRPVNG